MARITAFQPLDDRSYFTFVPLGDENIQYAADSQDPQHTLYYFPNGENIGNPIVIFDGRNFVYDPETGDPIGGTITSIEQGHFGEDDYLIDYLLTGVNISGSGNAPPKMSAILRGNDTITGSKFADDIDGFRGNDKLKGGAGADTFYFTTKPSVSNRDHITDFKHDVDHISLKNTVFQGIAPNDLSRAFHDITNQAVQRDDRILYNHNTGVLSYDADGSGASKAIKFAILDNHARLTYQDFDLLVV